MSMDVPGDVRGFLNTCPPEKEETWFPNKSSICEDTKAASAKIMRLAKHVRTSL
jgi:hypothetical protein